MSLVLTSEALRVVQRNERGQVVYRKRYKKGDVVDTSKMDDARVEIFKEKGILVEESDFEENSEDTSAAAVQATRGGFADTPTGGPAENAGQVESPDGEDDASDEQTEDAYDTMEYSQLQAEAKQRGLNAGGSAEDLRGRLREDDADNDE